MFFYYRSGLLSSSACKLSALQRAYYKCRFMLGPILILSFWGQAKQEPAFLISTPGDSEEPGLQATL